MTVELVTTSSPEIVEAMERLIPQLSRSAPALTAEQCEALIAQEGVFLFVFRPEAEAGQSAPILGMLTLATFTIPTGLRAWVEDVVVDGEARGLEETVDGISCTRSTGFVDVTAAGESKGAGLGRLAELLAKRGVEVSEVAAVGDSWNDISMFERADVPCAIGGAPDEVVEAAGGRTTPSVAAFIEALLACRWACSLHRPLPSVRLGCPHFDRNFKKDAAPGRF